MPNAFEQDFPTSTGVYIMRDMEKNILYIGKAKNLKVRLNQYYKEQDSRAMIPALLKKVSFIETILVDTEKEALLLENTLIKKHRPRFNVLLKDDKTFFSLKITHKHPWPALRLVRLKGKVPSDGKYFGPYAHGAAAKRTLELLRDLFPLRRCSNGELMNRSRPCLLFQMKKCIAPCVNKCTKDEYTKLVDQVESFLNGNREIIVKELQKEVQVASENLEYEKAALYVNRLESIQSTLEPQNVDKIQGGDFDVFGMYRDGDHLTVCTFIYREGKLSGSSQYKFKNVLETDEEVLERLLLQIYSGGQIDLPREILLPIPLKREKILIQILNTLYQKKIILKVPKRGGKLQSLQLAEKNAKAAFLSNENSIDRTLTSLQELLNLENYPQRIECTDNSHISGADLVSAFVVYIGGKKEISLYRKYNLKGIKHGDDYGALKEVLVRRCKRMKKDQDFPDLILIDGGKGHLKIAEGVFKDQQITAVDLVAVAKDHGRHDKGLSHETVYHEGLKCDLRHDSSEMRFIQRVRDEAHRYVIHYHRKKRISHVTESVIDKIPGIGPKKKKDLLRYFGSLKQVQMASKNEIENVTGISKSLATLIWSYFHV